VRECEHYGVGSESKVDAITRGPAMGVTRHRRTTPCRACLAKILS